MNYKLKHLSKYCCKPANELEFEAVKMAAELSEFPFYDGNFFGDSFTHFSISSITDNITMQMGVLGDRKEIPVLEFINKLRMSEEEAEKLEDDRVSSDVGNNWEITDGAKVFKDLNGHYFKTNDGAIATEVTLHKK